MAALAIVGAVAISGVGAPAEASGAAAQEITPSGVGPIRLGEQYVQLRAQHLVGKLTKGCQLAGPNARSAKLAAPLKGGVDFTLTMPRRVADISVSGGATARGVGIGATIAVIKRAYPAAKVDHSTDHMFGTTLVRIPRRAGGKLEFAVDVKTKKVVVIGVPFIATCE